MRQFAVVTHDPVGAAVYHFVTHAAKAQSLIRCRKLDSPHDRGEWLNTSPLLVNVERLLDIVHWKTELGLAPDDSLVMFVEGNLCDDNKRDISNTEFFIDHGAEWDQRCKGVALISLYFLNPASTFMKQEQKRWRALSERQRQKRIADITLLNLLATFAYDVGGLKYHNDTRGCVMDFCDNPEDIMLAFEREMYLSFCDECSEILSLNDLGKAVAFVGDNLRAHPLGVSQPTAGACDIVLCGGAGYETAAKDIKRKLRQYGVVSWIPQLEFAEGRVVWDHAFESECDSGANLGILLAPNDTRPWANEDVGRLIRSFRDRGIPVLWIILDGVPRVPDAGADFHDPRDTWIDFRVRTRDPLRRLAWECLGQSRVRRKGKTKGGPVRLGSRMTQERAGRRKRITRTEGPQLARTTHEPAVSVVAVKRSNRPRGRPRRSPEEVQAVRELFERVLSLLRSLRVTGLKKSVSREAVRSALLEVDPDWPLTDENIKTVIDMTKQRVTARQAAYSLFAKRYERSPEAFRRWLYPTS